MEENKDKKYSSASWAIGGLVQSMNLRQVFPILTTNAGEEEVFPSCQDLAGKQATEAEFRSPTVKFSST